MKLLILDTVRPAMALRFKGLALGLFIGLSGALACAVLPGFALEQGIGLPWLFAMRGVRPPPDDVVVVAIDQESAVRLGLSLKPTQWPRSLHAELIERLTEAGARTIALDLVFETPSSDRNGDHVLAKAMRMASNVLLVAALRRSVGPLPETPGEASGVHLVETAVPPLRPLAEAAAAYAPFPLPKAARVDAYWTFKYGAGDIPSLPAAALQVYAMGCYSELLNLWWQADPSLAVTLPADADAVMRRRGVPELMQAQRGALSGASHRLSILNSVPMNRAEGDACTTILSAIFHLYAGDGARFLNYYGPARTIKTISYSAALESLRSSRSGESRMQDFAGKAVFVGFSPAMASEQDRIRDDYRTVYSASDGLNLSGVEIAATAFANLLENRSVLPLGGFARIVLVLSWGIAVGILSRNVGATYSVLTAICAGSLYLAVAHYAFGTTGLWLPLIVPLCIQSPLALFAGAILRHREVSWERARIKRIFGHYLPGEVVEQLVRNVGPPTAINRVAFGVCLSTDAQQYSALAETMDPARLAEILNAYYQGLFEAVRRNGGRVADVVGDAMLAVWAGSASEATLKSRTCRAALEIAEAASSPGQTGERPVIPTRIGIHCGHILLGNIGAGERFEFRAVGDVVNTATRIEGLGKHVGTRLLLSEDVLEGTNEYLTRSLGSFVLAGKSNPVRVAELLGLRVDACEDDVRRCLRFAAALSHYENCRWSDAASEFSELLAEFPGDGPARFYLEHCEHLMRNPPPSTWDPSIRIERK